MGLFREEGAVSPSQIFKFYFLTGKNKVRRSCFRFKIGIFTVFEGQREIFAGHNFKGRHLPFTPPPPASNKHSFHTK